MAVDCGNFGCGKPFSKNYNFTPCGQLNFIPNQAVDKKMLTRKALFHFST